MRFVRAIKTILLLAALVVGLPSMAFAHAGHQRETPSAIAATASVSSASPQFDRAARPPRGSAEKIEAAGLAKQTSIGASFDRSPAPVACAPGACCCQGASSCGAGAHCALATSADIEHDLRSCKTLRLAGDNWHYADLVFGLDRPPKG